MEGDEPPNKHMSSRLPKPCARLGTQNQSRVAGSINRSEMQRTHCLRAKVTQAPDIALHWFFRRLKKFINSLRIKKEHMLLLVTFFPFLQFIAGITDRAKVRYVLGYPRGSQVAPGANSPCYARAGWAGLGLRA